MDFANFNIGGYVIDDLPFYIKKKLKKYVNKAREDNIPFNKQLAGHIKEEYILKGLNNDVDFRYYLLHLKDFFDQQYPFHKSLIQDVLGKEIDNSNIFLSETWVNFQKKYEFNPPHTHSGLYSYVIWLTVPFNNEDEKKLFTTSNQSHCGDFTFYITDFMGRIITFDIPVDKEWEGKIVFFPSKMPHSVYPFFTSDDERVSVSGNLCIDFELKSI